MVDTERWRVRDQKDDDDEGKKMAGEMYETLGNSTVLFLLLEMGFGLKPGRTKDAGRTKEDRNAMKPDLFRSSLTRVFGDWAE